MRIILGAILTLGLMSCSNINKGMIADQQLKDSIALADGDKVLGNILFGIDSIEFLRQVEIFKREQEDKIYDIEITDYEGEFTTEGKLWAVNFVSIINEESHPEQVPFEDFLTKKYGKMSKRYIWSVGNRNLMIIKDERLENFYVRLRNSYQRAMANQLSKDQDSPSEYKTFNFYVLRVENDSIALNKADEQRNNIEQLLQEDSLHKDYQEKKKVMQIRDL